ncbi:hypothetical protein CH359_06430 [Leptospira meyeri]|nr:hypothetical protein CH359_06430 [Leptospira meyeri]PJZ97118.1 hypothetical protein CH358_08100 [Leptospira meyeri]PKA10430.1 hypothetical protein CH372_19440 [Leptospira meyeri]
MLYRMKKISKFLTLTLIIHFLTSCIPSGKNKGNLSIIDLGVLLTAINNGSVSNQSDSAVFYVRGSNGADSNTGDQNSPFLTISKAIETMKSKNVTGQIRIAAGTYNESLTVPDGISLLGGYEVSNWDSRNNKDRSNANYRTRIIGTANTTITIEANSTKSIKIDGFNILGKNSSNSIAIDIRSNITLSNNTIDGVSTTSTGISISNGNSSILLNNDIWSTSPHAYGIYIDNASLSIINNVIRGGSTSGIYITGISIVRIFSNTLSNANRIIEINGASVTAQLKNNLIVNGVYGIHNTNGIVSATFNDVWNNTTGNYLNAAAGTGSISQNPLFVSGTDFRLQNGSVAICSGTDLTSDFLALNIAANDKEEIPRINSLNILWNIGAYETSGSTGLTSCQ